MRLLCPELVYRYACISAISKLKSANAVPSAYAVNSPCPRGFLASYGTREGIQPIRSQERIVEVGRVMLIFRMERQEKTWGDERNALLRARNKLPSSVDSFRR